MSVESLRYVTQGEWEFQGNSVAVGEKLIAIAIQPSDAAVMAKAKQLVRLLDRIMTEADEDQSDGIPLPGWYAEAESLVGEIHEDVLIAIKAKKASKR